MIGLRKKEPEESKKDVEKRAKRERKEKKEEAKEIPVAPQRKRRQRPEDLVKEEDEKQEEFFMGDILSEEETGALDYLNVDVPDFEEEEEEPVQEFISEPEPVIEEPEPVYETILDPEIRFSSNRIVRTFQEVAMRVNEIGLAVDEDTARLSYSYVSDKVKPLEIDKGNGALLLCPYLVYVNDKLVKWDKIFEAKLKGNRITVELGVSFVVPDGYSLQICSVPDLASKFGCKLKHDLTLIKGSEAAMPLVVELEAVAPASYVAINQPIIQIFIISNSNEECMEEPVVGVTEDYVAPVSEQFEQKEEPKRRLPDILKDL